MSKSNSHLLIGSRKGLIVYQQSKGRWEYQGLHFAGAPVSLAQGDPQGQWWVCIDHGHWGVKLHKSTDQGKSWSELKAPQFPEGEFLSEGKKATVNYLWSMAFGGLQHPKRVYIGTDPGALFVSEDGGQHFELVRGLWEHPSRMKQWMGGGRDQPGIHSILVDPDDGNHLYVAISCAGVFESKDGGKSWVPKNKGLEANFLPDPQSEIGHDPHLVVACPSNFKVLWQQNHCGIFKSMNGGELWEYVGERKGPAHFGFPIAVHESNPDMAFVVPLQSDEKRLPIDLELKVCKTTDGGKSWRSFQNGLESHPAFDLVYRHSLDILGETLAIGTTTGNLYLSHDLGENWETLNHNLPLIYSLRFS